MTKARILIVEDDAIVAKDLQHRLADMAYVVVAITDSGEIAIEKAQTLLPDVVLMDIRLRGAMDGITAAEKIGQNNNIPVIFVTAYADDETLRRARQIHPAGYVLKPFDPRNLYVAIEMALYSRPLPENQ